MTELSHNGKFAMGERVTKTKGSSWTGRVVGIYSTSLTPIGYDVESENEPGSVQLYPEAALSSKGDEETGFCDQLKQPGGCRLHNLQCGYPDCDKRPASKTDPLSVTAENIGVSEFKPHQSINAEAGITEYVFEDAPYVAKPVFDGVYHFVDWMVSIDGCRLVGLQFWDIHKSPSDFTTPKPAVAEPVEDYTLTKEYISNGRLKVNGKPTHQAEPVAWRYRYANWSHNDWCLTTIEPPKTTIRGAPLPISEPLYPASALQALQGERDELVHDIGSYVKISSIEATRAEAAEARLKALKGKVGAFTANAWHRVDCQRFHSGTCSCGLSDLRATLKEK